MRNIAVNFAMTPTANHVTASFGVKYAIVTSARPGSGIWQMVKPSTANGFMFTKEEAAIRVANILFEDGWNIVGVLRLDAEGHGGWAEVIHKFDCAVEPEPINPDAPSPSNDSGSW